MEADNSNSRATSSLISQSHVLIIINSGYAGIVYCIWTTNCSNVTITTKYVLSEYIEAFELPRFALTRHPLVSPIDCAEGHEPREAFHPPLSDIKKKQDRPYAIKRCSKDEDPLGPRFAQNIRNLLPYPSGMTCSNPLKLSTRHFRARSHFRCGVHRHVLVGK